MSGGNSTVGSRVDRKIVKVGDKSMSWSPRVINTRPPVLRSSLENKIVGLNSYYLITFYTFIIIYTKIGWKTEVSFQYDFETDGLEPVLSHTEKSCLHPVFYEYKNVQE